jgi:hypothetical protein
MRSVMGYHAHASQTGAVLERLAALEPCIGWLGVTRVLARRYAVQRARRPRIAVRDRRARVRDSSGYAAAQTARTLCMTCWTSNARR